MVDYVVEPINCKDVGIKIYPRWQHSCNHFPPKLDDVGFGRRSNPPMIVSFEFFYLTGRNEPKGLPYSVASGLSFTVNQ